MVKSTDGKGQVRLNTEYKSTDVKYLALSTTEPLGGVRNLKVVDPTISTLTARWEPAEGDVRQYKVFYVPVPGADEKMVRHCISPMR